MSGQEFQIAGVREGDVLAGKYRVERVLGAGGMGVVVAAHHMQLDEMVALKFLSPQAMHNSEAAARFLREARAAVKIRSEHVVRVSDVGQLESGAPYMVMEYLDGGDLAAWLRQRGRLPVEQAVEFVLQACVAVADAHALGIIHRDLKPANLFCVRRSDGQLTIKVLDFGISKLLGYAGSSGAMTSTSATMGTPLYMSPEQMRSSKDVDARTDIWALGAILHELLAGRPAFVADSVTELAIMVASDPAPPVRNFRPEVPSGLEAVILKCLEKRREDRFDSVGRLAVAMLPFAPQRAKSFVDRIAGILSAAGSSDGVLAPSVSPPLRASGGESAGTITAVGQTTAGPARGRAAAVGAAIAAVLALGASVAALSRRRAEMRGDPPLAASAASEPSTRGPVAGTAATGTPSTMESIPAVEPGSAPATRTKTRPSAPATPPTPPSIAGDVGAAGTPSTRPVVAPGGRTISVAPTRQVPNANPGVAPQPAASRAPPDCNPPFYFDARGNRVFKPECF